MLNIVLPQSPLMKFDNNISKLHIYHLNCAQVHETFFEITPGETFYLSSSFIIRRINLRSISTVKFQRTRTNSCFGKRRSIFYIPMAPSYRERLPHSKMKNYSRNRSMQSFLISQPLPQTNSRRWCCFLFSLTKAWFWLRSHTALNYPHIPSWLNFRCNLMACPPILGPVIQQFQITFPRQSNLNKTKFSITREHFCCFSNSKYDRHRHLPHFLWWNFRIEAKTEKVLSTYWNQCIIIWGTLWLLSRTIVQITIQ